VDGILTTGNLPFKVKFLINKNYKKNKIRIFLLVVAFNPFSSFALLDAVIKF